MFPDRNLAFGTAEIEFFNASSVEVAHLPLKLGRGRIRSVTFANPVRTEDVEFVRGRADIVLPAPVRPGKSVMIRIDFISSFLPDPQGWGYRLLSGSWHPKVACCEGEMERDEEQADSYEVAIVAPESEAIVTSGQMVSRTGLPDGHRRWLFRADNITNFGVVSSPNLIGMETGIEGVSVACYSFPSMTERAKGVLTRAVRAVAFYKELMGFYPQPVLTLVPGSGLMRGGAPVASNLIALHNAVEGLDEPGWDFQDWILAHEIAHQYWGFDGVLDAQAHGRWLGIGLGLYMDRLYSERYNPGATARHRDLIGSYVSAAANRQDVSLPVDGKARQAAPSRLITHCKSYAVVHMLERLIGPERFLPFLRELQQRFRHRRLSVGAFQIAAEAAAGRPLGSFFDDWIWRSRVLDVRIEDVREGQEGRLDVCLRNAGDAVLPVDVEVAFESGLRVRQTVSVTATEDLSFGAPDAVRFVNLDPDGRTALCSSAASRFRGHPFVQAKLRHPRKYRWNTNRVRLELSNCDAQPHRLALSVGCSNQVLSTGSAEIETPPDSRIEFAFHVTVPPFRGKADLHFRLFDETDHVLVLDEHHSTSFTEDAPSNSRHCRAATCGEEQILPPLERIGFEHVMVYFPAGTLPREQAALAGGQFERELLRLQPLLNPAWSGRVQLYLFPDTRSRMLYTSHPGPCGIMRGNIVAVAADCEIDAAHEAAHVLANSLGWAPAWWGEGLACHFGAERQWEGRSASWWLAAHHSQGALLPLDALLVSESVSFEFGATPLAHIQAGSSVGFLIEEYGLEKVVEATRTLMRFRSEENRRDLNRIFGVSLGALEEQWRQRVAIEPRQC